MKKNVVLFSSLDFLLSFKKHKSEFKIDTITKFINKIPTNVFEELSKTDKFGKDITEGAYIYSQEWFQDRNYQNTRIGLVLKITNNDIVEAVKIYPFKEKVKDFDWHEGLIIYSKNNLKTKQNYQLKYGITKQDDMQEKKYNLYMKEFENDTLLNSKTKVIDSSKLQHLMNLNLSQNNDKQL